MHVVQDSIGYIWIGTESGLSKYDGVSFVNYVSEKDNSASLPNNVINALFVDSQGALWVATNNGLSKYNPVQDNFKNFIPNAELLSDDPHNIIKSIDEDNQGNIHFLAESGRIFRIKEDQIEMQLNVQQPCKYMMIDDSNNCWISSRGDLFEFDINDNLTRQYKLKYPSTVKEREVNCIVKADSLLFIASYKSDLMEFNYQSGEFVYYDFVEGIGHTNYLMKEEDALYIGTSQGLKILNLQNGETHNFQEDVMNVKSLSTNAVEFIYRDNQQNLWVGTNNGLNVSYRNKGFVGYAYNYNNFQRNSDVNAICIDELNRLWLGYTEGGIELKDGNNNTIKIFDKVPGLLPASKLWEVFCFYEDGNKDIWIGTYLNGLLKYDLEQQRFIQFYPDNKKNFIPGADVRSVTEDHSGNIWIAIHGKGIYVQKKNEAHFEPVHNYFPEMPQIVNQKWIFHLNFDSSGNLWVSSNNGCLFYNFSTHKFRHFNDGYDNKYSISDNYVTQTFFDAERGIWVGTRTGLNFMHREGENIITIGRKDGLPNEYIQAINEDSNGNIWVSTSNGIAKIKRMPGKRFQITKYDKSQGLHSNSFKKNSTFRSDNGRIYFGGFRGYTFFDPENIRKDTTPPKVVFTDFYVFNKKVKVCSEKLQEKTELCLEKSINHIDVIRVKEKNNLIGFGFSALNFINPDKNNYKYKLEGFDKQWLEIGNRNTVYYTNLKPGEYTFKVLAANGDGVWSENSASVGLKILPPFWKTSYAFILYLLAIVGIVLYFNKLSVEKEKILMEVKQHDKIKELRTRFFMNVSHELKTPLTLISIPLKKIVNNYKTDGKPPTMHEMGLIYRNVNRLMRIMNQIFDFRKIELNKVNIERSRSNIIEFTDSVLEYFDYQFNAKNISLKTNYQSRDITFYFDPDKMDKILYNLISNALKYTPEHGRINISVKENKDDNGRNIHWIIEDNGKGIQKARLATIFDRFSYEENSEITAQGGTGIGLSIVKEFVELHQGTINIESEFNESGDNQSFTKVVLTFPDYNESLPADEIVDSADSAQTIINNNKIVSSLFKMPEQKSDMPLTDSLPGIDSSAYKLLIIDDDKDICNLLKSELSVYYQIYTANDGDEGFLMAKKILPDLIISDIMMPGKDGYEVCKLLKRAIETSHIPVILLTAKSADEDEINAYSTGADAFISKPFNLQKLLSRVESLISNRTKLKNMFLNSYGIELKKVVPTRTDEKFIQKLLHIIHENLSDPNLNVEKITREIGISRAQLYKKVNSVANTSVNLFIRSVRLKKAGHLLAGGDMNITEVAYAVGFDNLPYFSKCFQEEYGVSPSKYAQTHRS
jgi:signal transduction histidine kinase/ligand-binding sensor domain-containing protein/DNA-binding response OmpR family regulator